MKIIGLTGGIASGKSTVAAELEILGAVVLDADQAAHEVINTPSVQQTLVGRWGPKALGADGEIDRRWVASRVFSDEGNGSSELEFLEKTLHPLIRQQFESQLGKLRSNGCPAVVIDAPLLLEAGWENMCDYLVFVDSPRIDRLGRAKLRNWTETEFDKRAAAQLPIAEKRSRSSHILANSGTLASLREQVGQLWHSLALD